MLIGVFSAVLCLNGGFRQCTWEGDNTVMALQTARYLVASFERLDAGEPLSGYS